LVARATCVAAIAIAVALSANATSLSDAFTLTVYEQSGSIDAYVFQSSDSRLYETIAGDPGPVNWSYNGYDFGTSGCEYYDLYFSDAAGNLLSLSPGDPLPSPAYLTIVCMDLNCNNGLPDAAPTWIGAGNNLDAVKLAFADTVRWANAVTHVAYGTCEEPFSAKTSNFADATLGPQDGIITKMGCGRSAITLRFETAAPAPPDTTLQHDPMYANAHPFFAWWELEAAWYTSFDGFMNVTQPTWYNGIISDRAFDESENPMIICRVYRGSSTNYIFGFTSMPPESSDFHYRNIDLGIYLHSSGTLRPSWDVDNSAYWSETIPVGIYDVKVALDRTAGTVSFWVQHVDSYASPLSDFSSPLWTAVETRPIAGSYNIQINPYSSYGRVYDVWCSYGAAPPPPPSPAPTITSIRDVPNDQGRAVRIKWSAAPCDSFGSAKQITAYAIWRRIDAGLLAAPSAQGVALMYPPGEWDYVTSVPACCEKTYATVVATLADSTITAGMHYSVFFVRALTATSGEYFDSPVDSGYSVDNVAPAEPEGMRGVQVANGLKIVWEPCPNPDFAHYVLRKAVSPSDPAPAMLATPTEALYVDETWTPENNAHYYMVSAVDRSGNEGACALLSPQENVGTRLRSFSVRTSGAAIELAWQLSECDEGAVLVVLREEIPGGEYAELPASGLVRDDLDFVYRDGECVPGGVYRYRVAYSDGSATHVLFETKQIAAPARALALYQNQPNPFNPSTMIRYYLPERMRVRLEVYDVAGRLVARLVDGEQGQGEKTVRWNGLGAHGASVSSGVFYCRLQAGKDVVSRTMVLLR